MHFPKMCIVRSFFLRSALKCSLSTMKYVKICPQLVVEIQKLSEDKNITQLGAHIFRYFLQKPKQFEFKRKSPQLSHI